MPLFTAIRSSFHFSALTTLFTAIHPVLAQAPVNDVVSWPSGLLLLASVLYAALGTPPDKIWEIEPAIGWFLCSGLPMISIPMMQRVNWVASACHFVPGIRTAYGKSNFWIQADQVTALARSEALRKVLQCLQCVLYVYPEPSTIDPSLWSSTPEGLVIPAPNTSGPLISPPIKPSSATPSAHDFLLFAAIDYHVFREWEVVIKKGGQVVFSTKNMPASSVVDVDSEEFALFVVAAQLVRRPHSQSKLHALACNDSDKKEGPYTLDLDKDPVKYDTPICAVDFHSYAPEGSKVTASLTELATAYYRVVQYIKQNSDPSNSLKLAQISVGQTLWIAILGGVLLDKGRLTIQNLHGRWGMKEVTADEAYLTRIETVLAEIGEYANKPAFFDLVFSGGLNRRSAYPFLIAGLFGQMIVCYFLSVGTSAGVWTSVALSNSLYAGRLTDWHSLYYGKTAVTDEPGMKMYVPGSQELMAIATFDRSSPKQGSLRPGILLNTFGLAAAIFGAVFQGPTRDALNFGPFSPTPGWVVYTSVVLCMGTTMLIAVTLALQQLWEKTWADDSEFPTRCMAYTTLPCSVIVSGLAVWFQYSGLRRFWPILDALTWVSGMPLGMLENGRMFSVDDNMLHLVLLNRWIMGAVASSVGSA